MDFLKISTSYNGKLDAITVQKTGSISIISILD